MKIVIALAFVLILASLGSALFYMMRDRSGSNRMVRALTIRIACSVILFLLILLAWKMGWIQSSGIPYRAN